MARLWLHEHAGRGQHLRHLGSRSRDCRPRRRGGERWTVDDDVGDGPTVVVIEDDPRSAELVELHLRAAGLRAVGASHR